MSMDLLKGATAVIFDADGLLIDSEPLWDKTREEFAKKYGKVITPDFHVQFQGMGMKEVLTTIKNIWHIPGEIPDLMQSFRDTFYSLAEKGKLQTMPGVKKLLEKLSLQKKILAVATGGHTGEKMLVILKRLELEKYFSLIVSSDEVPNGKPAPDIFLYTVERLHISKNKCVILEDAVNGVQAAKNAGMKVIGVQKDDHVRQLLIDNKADVTVKSLEELL